MVRDGWMEYISPEVAALCPTGIGGWFSFLREDENGKTIDEILDDWKNNYDFVKYILKIKDSQSMTEKKSLEYLMLTSMTSL